MKEKEKLKIESLFNAIDEVAKQNHINSDEVYKILEESIVKAFHSKFDPDAEVELKVDQENKIFELINHSKIVTNDEVDPNYRAVYIPLKDAKKIKADAKEGDFISEVVPFKQYAKIVAGSIRQMLTQSVREKKKAAVYAKYKSLVGEMIPVTAISVSRNHAIFALDDGTTAFMPETLMNKKIKIGIGERLKIYVEDVLEDSKDAQIIVSNGSTQLVKRVLEVEVPEIMQGTIEIIKIARIAGERSKVAVKSTMPEVDAVGAIIGPGGERIKSISAALDGEKVEIVKYSPDLNEYISNALSPARVVSITDVLNDDNTINDKYKIVITPNRHQTLAIGRRGTNIKLAAELIGIRIDIKSIDEAKEDGIAINWNGNVKEEELQNIENGEGRNFTRRSGSQRYNTKNDSFNSDSFNDEISSFNEDISDGGFDQDDSFEITEDMFSQLEDTQQVEPEVEEIDIDDFDFDFDDIDDDFK